MEFASCRPSGAFNFKAAPRNLENLEVPEFRILYTSSFTTQATIQRHTHTHKSFVKQTIQKHTMVLNKLEITGTEKLRLVYGYISTFI
jgi:hypothetical protein